VIDDILFALSLRQMLVLYDFYTINKLFYFKLTIFLFFFLFNLVFLSLNAYQFFYARYA